MNAKATGEEFRYWAFICYAPEDEPWANWLHKALETYGLPKILQGKSSRFGPLPKRLFPVFRDRDELPLASAQGDQIEWALRESRSLIVICSPAAVASPEVDRQIRYFKSLGREALVYSLVIDGQPSGTKSESPPAELLPKAARFQVDADQRLTATPANPLIVDARRGKDGKANTRLKLAAAILGCDFAVLKQRDVERAQRRIQLILSAVMILLAVFVALGVQLYFEKNKAEQARREAERQLEVAQKAEMWARTSAAQALKAQAAEAVARKVEVKAREEAQAAERKALAAKEEEAKAKEDAVKARDAALEAQKREAVARKQAENALRQADERLKSQK